MGSGVDPYVSAIAGGVSPQPDHVARDAQHGRQGGEPAERVGPQRVRVAEVLDRCPLHDVEDEYALWENEQYNQRASKQRKVESG